MTDTVTKKCPNATPKTLNDVRMKWSDTLRDAKTAIKLNRKLIGETGKGTYVMLNAKYQLYF